MKELVEKYIQLRDAKADLDAAHKAKTAKLTTVMKQIEGFILEGFNEQGIDSASTPAGTAYKSVRTSATVADWDATLAFIRDNEMWSLLERRVSKNVAVEYKEEHGDLPPGLNWSEEIVINVRRS